MIISHSINCWVQLLKSRMKDLGIAENRCLRSDLFEILWKIIAKGSCLLLFFPSPIGYMLTFIDIPSSLSFWQAIYIYTYLLLKSIFIEMFTIIGNIAEIWLWYFHIYTSYYRPLDRLDLIVPELKAEAAQLVVMLSFIVYRLSIID